MSDSISQFCDVISNEGETCALPFMAIITNPSGCVDIPFSVSEKLSFVMICYEGFANIHLEKQDCVLNRSQGVVIVGHNRLSKMSFSSDFKGHIMAQTIEFCDSIVTMDKYAVSKHYGNLVSINLTVDQDRQYFLYFEWLKYALRRNPKDAENRIRNLLTASFWVFSSHENSEESISCRSDQITADFLKLLENEGYVTNDAEYYSARLRISKRSLARAVKQVTGKSVFNFVTEQKVKRAKEMISAMLQESTMAVVSERLGFKTSASFSRFFKSAVGMTPSEFRNIKSRFA